MKDKRLLTPKKLSDGVILGWTEFVISTTLPKPVEWIKAIRT